MALSCVEYQVGESIQVPIWYNYSIKCESRSARSQFHFCNVDCTCGNPNNITVSKCNGSSLVVYSQVYRNLNLLTGSCSNTCSPYCQITYCNDTDLVQIVDYCAYFVNTYPEPDDGCYYTQASILPIKFLVNPHNTVVIPPVTPACSYGPHIWFAYWPDQCNNLPVASLMLTRTINAYPLPSPTNSNTWTICDYSYYDGGAKQPKWFATNCISIPIVSNGGSPSIGVSYACTQMLCPRTGYSIPDQIKPVIGTDENNNPFTLAKYSPCVRMTTCCYYNCCNCHNSTGLNRDALIGIITPIENQAVLAGVGSCTLSNNWCVSSTWNCVKSFLTGVGSLRAYSPCTALGSTSNAITLNDELVEPKGPYYNSSTNDWAYYKDAFSIRCSCYLPSWSCSCCWLEDPVLIYKGIDFNPTCENGYTCVAFVSCIQYK